MHGDEAASEHTAAPAVKDRSRRARGRAGTSKARACKKRPASRALPSSMEPSADEGETGQTAEPAAETRRVIAVEKEKTKKRRAKPAKPAKAAKDGAQKRRTRARSKKPDQGTEERRARSPENPFELPPPPGQTRLENVGARAVKKRLDAGAQPEVQSERLHVEEGPEESPPHLAEMGVVGPESADNGNGVRQSGTSSSLPSSSKASAASDASESSESSESSTSSSAASVSMHYCWRPCSNDDSIINESVDEQQQHGAAGAVAGGANASSFLQMRSHLMPQQTRSRAEMFAFPARHVERIHAHFGYDAVERLNDNMSQLKICSLYSGLGGAEISVHLMREALVKHIQERNLPIIPPRVPTCLLACEMNADCHKVLRSHEVPWTLRPCKWKSIL